MKKMMVLSLMLVFVVGALIACGSGNQGNSTKNLDLTSVDSGKAFDVEVGTIIKLTLSENQTTPVHWQDKPEIDGDSTISEVTSEYITDPNPDGRMGVGGKREFSFKVESQGTAKLTFKATHISDANDVYDTFEVTLVSK